MRLNSPEFGRIFALDRLTPPTPHDILRNTGSLQPPGVIRMNRRVWLMGLATWLTASIALAQDEPAVEKAAPPAKVAPVETKTTLIPQGLRSFIVLDNRFTGKDDPVTNRNRKGKIHCPICEFGLNPAILVIARKVPTDAKDPLIDLVVQLDRLGKTYKSSRFGVATVFLSLEKNFEDDDYRDRKIAEAEKPFADAKLESSMIGITEATVAEEGQPVVSPAVKAFNIGENDAVTVILYNRLKVLDRWTFTADQPITDDQTKTITVAVKKLLDPKPRSRPNFSVSTPN